MSVSILIPAFRPTFLRQAIASVFTQGHEDFELVISDDSNGNDVRAVIDNFKDSRIRYVNTGGRIGALENTRLLWNEAEHDLIKYVLDDDVLMPDALAELLDCHEKRPQSPIYFGHRNIIDARGKIIGEPRFVASGLVEINRAQISRIFVGGVKNPVGELSNILINRRAGVTESDFMSYEGFRLYVLGDVAIHINSSRMGSIVGIAKTLTGFRKHAEQNSSPTFNPTLAFGFVEWELFLRGEYQAGQLTIAQANHAIGRLEVAYTNWGGRLPGILRFKDGLGTLRNRIHSGETALLDEAFRAAWDNLVSEVFPDRDVSGAAL